MMKENKIGTFIVALGAIIIITLLAVLIFIKPAPQPQPGNFKGPTSAPYANGPKDLPPPQ